MNFNYNSLGIQAAAKTYFNKSAADLKVQEAALLIGMLKGPSLYNPRTKLVNATNRRNVVFYQMTEGGFLTSKQKDSLYKIPIKISIVKLLNTMC